MHSYDEVLVLGRFIQWRQMERGHSNPSTSAALLLPCWGDLWISQVEKV